MVWDFQSVKYLDELVDQYGGRKSKGREAEFQGSERMRMPAAWRLRQFRKRQAEIPNTPLGLTGIGIRNGEGEE